MVEDSVISKMVQKTFCCIFISSPTYSYVAMRYCRLTHFFVIYTHNTIYMYYSVCTIPMILVWLVGPTRGSHMVTPPGGGGVIWLWPGPKRGNFLCVSVCVCGWVGVCVCVCFRERQQTVTFVCTHTFKLVTHTQLLTSAVVKQAGNSWF